jgi:uncharacterized membrane protein
MNGNKYPPSLLYISINISFALILLSFAENIKNWFTGTIVIFGRTAFFYYIIHFYLVHILLAVAFYAQGNSTQ